MAGGLTAEHRARIEAALPPGKVMTPEAWADLEEVVVGYRIFETRRTTYPIVKERKHWKRLGKAVDTVAAELFAVRRCGPTRTRCGAIRRWRRCRRYAARSRRASPASTISGAPSAAGENPHREFLYWGVMRVWTDRLGGKLRYSNSPEGSTHGPLVRFFVACVEPILGDKTPGAGIADIIDRERDGSGRDRRRQRQLR